MRWIRPRWCHRRQMTVVLSERGWVRAAKGHDIDPLSLAYKAGDAFKTFDRGRSNQAAVFHRLYRARLYAGGPHTAFGAGSGRTVVRAG